MERAARERPFPLWQRIYFEAPEELEPESVLEPMPVLPEPLVLSELELGKEVEPLEDDEPSTEPCSRRQRSFSVPVRVSHWVLLPLIEGELLELPLALGEVVDEPVEPLVEDSVPTDPPTLCDDDCAIAAAENANNVATAAVEKVFNIVASPL